MKWEVTEGQHCVVLSIYQADPRATVRLILLPDEAKAVMVELGAVIRKVEKGD